MFSFEALKKVRQARLENAGVIELHLGKFDGFKLIKISMKAKEIAELNEIRNFLRVRAHNFFIKFI